MSDSRLPTQAKTPSDGSSWGIWLFLALSLLLILVFLLSLGLGSVRIPLDEVVKILGGGEPGRQTWRTILFDFRLPKSLTAVLVGAALSVAGLQMQTLFRNPLADPYILGINSGASLGVALVVLSVGGSGALLMSGLGFYGDLGLAVAASLGSALVLGLILLVGNWVRNPTTLLILGLMFGYATSAVVSLLIYFSIPERIQAYLVWSYGSFGGVTWSQLRVMLPAILAGLFISALLPKSLNAMLLGEEYARTMGVNVRRSRLLILTSASLLTGVATAFCGPIGFIGVAIPHLVRNVFHKSDHRFLLPAVILVGATAALLADMIAQMPGANFILPINVVTSFFGAPFVLWMLIKQRRGGTSFNV